MLHFLVLFLIVSFGILIVAYWQISPLLEEISKLNLPSNHALFQAVEKFNYMSTVSVICILIFCLAMFYNMALIISNRVAGPLFNLCRSLQNIRNSGEVKHVAFRKKDYFHEVADEVNKTIDFVKEDLKN